MYCAKGSLCYIEELTIGNEEKLFSLMSEFSKDYKKLVSDEPIPGSLKLFKTKIISWFSNGRAFQFLIYNNENVTIGTIFFYSGLGESHLLSCSAFFIPQFRNSIIISEAFAMIMIFLRDIVNINSFNVSIYLDNVHMKAILTKLNSKYLSTTDSVVNPKRKVENYSITLTDLSFMKHFFID